MTGRPAIPRRILVALGFLVSAAALGLVLSSIDLSRTAAIITTGRPEPLLLVLVVMAAQLGLRARRWAVLLPGPIAVDGRPGGGALPVRRIAPVLLVGYLGNAVLPARLGEPLRAVVLAQREGRSAPAVFGSVVLERLLDTLALAILAAVAVVAMATPAWVARGALTALVLATTVLLGLALAPRLRWLSRPAGRLPAGLVRALRAVVEGARARGPRAVAGAALLSAAAWLLDAVTYWLVGQSLGLPLSPLGAVVISAVTVLSTAVPAAPGYVGTFELATVAAATAVGLDQTAGLAIALVAHVVTVVPLAVGGAVSMAALGVDWRRTSLAAAQPR